MADINSKGVRLCRIDGLEKIERKFEEKFENLKRKYYRIKDRLESQSEYESTIQRKYGKIKIRLLNAEGIVNSMEERLAAVENNYTVMEALLEKYGQLRIRLRNSERLNMTMESRLAAVESECI